MELAERPARKGTKSCAECRRRKLRCDWASQEATTCRRCEERGTQCVAQTFYVKPSDPHKLSSRQRIQALEAKVASLVKAVNSDTTLSPGSSSAQETPGSYHGATSTAGEEDFEDLDASNESDDVVPQNQPPAHLSALFENDWLSSDADRQEERLRSRVARSTARLLAGAKLDLEKLVPPREDVIAITNSSFSWKGLDIMEIEFPEPWLIGSEQELLEGYELMQSANANTFSMAFWLLAFSKIVHQVSMEPGLPNPAVLNIVQNAPHLTKLVGRVIENKILRHDRLLGTSEGIGLAILCVRLQIFRCNFQRGWLLLRRAIAVAELIGFPQIARSVLLDTTKAITPLGVQGDPTQAKAHLWESLVDLDKVCSTMLNLPASTRAHESQSSRPLLVNGVVQDRNYMSRLADLSIQTQYIDNWNVSGANKAALYPTVLELDRQLRELTLQVPAAWWAAPMSNVDPRHIIHFWQAYVAMRVHLPFALERLPDQMHMYSHLAGIDACKTLLTRYLILRQSLLPAFFLGRLLDIQAFTASVILLLTSQNMPASANPYLANNQGQVEALVARAVELMAEKSEGTSGASDFGRVGSHSLYALKQLLSAKSHASIAQEELTLKVPLLGKIQIRQRELQPMNQPMSQSLPIWDNPQPSDFTVGPEQYQQRSPSEIQADANLMSALSLRDVSMNLYEPFSWFVVNNYEDSFQDALMADPGMENWDNFTM